MELYLAWVAFWATLMGVPLPIPVEEVDLKGKFWAQVWVDQYGMPSIRMDPRLSRGYYRDSALHEVCHIKLGHPDHELSDDEKEAEVKSCMRLYGRASR